MDGNSILNFSKNRYITSMDSTFRFIIMSSGNKCPTPGNVCIINLPSGGLAKESIDLFGIKYNKQA